MTTQFLTCDFWQTYEDFDMDIKEDVEGECSKFGKLKHIYVDKYVHFLFDVGNLGCYIVNQYIWGGFGTAF